MPKSDDTLDISDLIDHPLPGPSLTKDTASMPVVDRCEEEDGSDSEASTEIDEDDKEDEGLVFEVSEQALVRYSVLSWSEIAEYLPDSWRPAGSVWKLDVVNKVSSVLKFIHFPHSLCHAEPEHEPRFSVLHVKGAKGVKGHDNIEPTVDFTASHVKWRVSSLSPVGPITHESQSVLHHGAVLVYKEQGHQEQFSFHVFLASNNKSEIKAINKQLLSSGKKFITIYKSADCTLEVKGYQLTSEPEGEVRPSDPQRLEFRAGAAERKGFFEVIFDQPLTFELFLMDPDFDQKLWTVKITKAKQSTGQKKKSRLEVMPSNIPLLPGQTPPHLYIPPPPDTGRGPIRP
ncbi:unnamed protein product [Boreogadus saida]